MNDYDEFHKTVSDFIEKESEAATKEAAQLFPHHPKAQEVYVKLRSIRGGIIETVNTLELHSEYAEYKEQVDISLKNGLFEIANIQMGAFLDFCEDQVRDNFYMFK